MTLYPVTTLVYAVTIALAALGAFTPRPGQRFLFTLMAGLFFVLHGAILQSEGVQVQDGLHVSKPDANTEVRAFQYAAQTVDNSPEIVLLSWGGIGLGLALVFLAFASFSSRGAWAATR